MQSVARMTRSLQVRRLLMAQGLDDFPLTHVDILILALLVDLGAITSLIVSDGPMADRLGKAFEACSYSVRVAAPGAAILSDAWTVALLPFGALPHGHDGPAPLNLFYGCTGFLPLDALREVGSDFSFMPLASTSPVLWHTGLAWLARNDRIEACASATRAMVALLNDRQFDALALLDRIHDSEAAARRAATLDPSMPAAEARIKDLEQQLSAMQRSALVQHKILVAEAAYRREWTA